MSEEKIYAIKNDEGEFLSFSDNGDSIWNKSVGHFETYKQKAISCTYRRGGHVVTLIEEPEKVVLTKEQAEIVENARIIDIPATYISDRTDEHNGEKILGEEILLIKALTNGYTVEKEKRYLVHKGVGGKHLANVQFAQAYRSSVHPETLSWIITSWVLTNEDNNRSFLFTESEIEYYGLQDCEKEEVTNNEQ